MKDHVRGIDRDAILLRAPWRERSQPAQGVFEPRLEASADGDRTRADGGPRPKLRNRGVVGACLSRRYEIEPALIEYDVGAYEDRSDAEAWQALAGLEQRWIEGDRDARMPGGESCNDIRNRFRPFIARVMDRFKASGSVVHLDSATGRPVGHPGLFDVAVVLIGHSGTYTQALPEVLDNVSPGFAVTHSLAHTAYVEAALRPDGLHCLRWGDELFG